MEQSSHFGSRGQKRCDFDHPIFSTGAVVVQGRNEVDVPVSPFTTTVSAWNSTSSDKHRINTRCKIIVLAIICFWISKHIKSRESKTKYCMHSSSYLALLCVNVSCSISYIYWELTNVYYPLTAFVSTKTNSASCTSLWELECWVINLENRSFYI